MADLKAAIAGKVILPGQDGFDEAHKRFNLAAEDLKAAIVVYPRDARDISKAVRYARTNHLEIAVCGGGQSYCNASATRGGLMIHLGHMRHVSVNEMDRTVFVQGGCTWADVDAATDSVGLACVGGMVNDTGVGGMTLGGGYGFLTGLHGLVVDNLLSATLVTADGQIRVVSADKDAELFWAIRGGGGNFGIAADFTYRAYEQGPVFAGSLYFPTTLLEEVVECVNRCADDVEKDPKAALVLAFGCPAPEHSPTIMTLLFYDGTEEEGRAFFSDILSVDGMILNNVAPMSYAAANTIFPIDEGYRRLASGTTWLRLPVEVVESWLVEFCNLVEDYPDAKGSRVIMELISNHKIREVPNHAMAFGFRGPHYNLLIQGAWQSPHLDGEIRARTRALADFIKSQTISFRAYGNYAQDREQALTVYGENIQRLQNLKAKYDRDQVFNKWHPIEPEFAN